MRTQNWKEVNTISDPEKRSFRRTFGAHITSIDVFQKYIFPEIKDKLYEFLWVDLYAGEGNLILPILEFIPNEKRIDFFKDRIYLFDVQPEMVQKCVINAKNYGIPSKIAQNNINYRDNLDNFPKILLNKAFPIYHITNPPYLYLGYIRKHEETQKYLRYFEAQNDGYQDLYQIAMMNDLRNDLKNLIYIIPSNFLFGASVSNKFRLDFLKCYKILKMLIFETKMFEFTGTNICIGFFKRKCMPKHETLKFKGLKIKNKRDIINKHYVLKPKYKYRAGSEFLEFLETNKSKNPLSVKYYLLNDEVIKNKGKNQISVIDSNEYVNNEYKKKVLYVNDNLKQKIESNILYVQTVDKGSAEGRVGLGIISDDFNIVGIYVSSNTYRTHPIQIFLEPQISIEDQILLKNYFNFVLEYFRNELDSEFLTTYKYSKAEYTRKYLGLTQVRSLIETFPIMNMERAIKKQLIKAIEKKDFHKILEIGKKRKNG